MVRKEGDVYIDGIPMVDQGQKGYCVVASAARVFGYYQIAVDQHEIAQIASSSAEGGTSMGAMLDALGDIAGRFRVRVKNHIDFDYKDMGELTKDYNRVAKRAGQREFSTDPGTNMWMHFDSFDPELLKETRLKSKSGISRFEKEVEASINAGIPLLWTLTVGIYEEPKRLPQSRGGHHADDHRLQQGQAGDHFHRQLGGGPRIQALGAGRGLLFDEWPLFHPAYELTFPPGRP